MKIVRVVLSFLLLATFAGLADAENWPTRRLRKRLVRSCGGWAFSSISDAETTVEFSAPA